MAEAAGSTTLTDDCRTAANRILPGAKGRFPQNTEITRHSHFFNDQGPQEPRTTDICSALLCSPLPSALLCPSSLPRSLPDALPPPRDGVCPCWTDTVAIRAEESWRPDYRERPVLTHPGLANGVSVWISELLGRYYGYKLS